MSQVFISYRHSDTHSPRVADLVKALRAAGVNVVIDSDQLPAGPNGGWPKWSQQQVEKADKVLIACTPGWHECYEADGPLGIGHGCAAEAHIVRQMLYNQGFNNARFRVVLLAPEDINSIPLGLQAYHRFHWHKPEDQAHVLTWLTATASSPAAVQSSVISWPTLHTPFDRGMANCHDEFHAFEAMLQGQSAKRALLIHGPSGRGKTHLTNEFQRMAIELGLDHSRIECRNGVTLEAVLHHQIEIPGFTIGASDSFSMQCKHLIDACKNLNRPHLLLIDTFEQASQEVKDWLERDVLARLHACPALRVVVCGQSVPNQQHAVWRGYAQSFDLKPIFDTQAWQEFCVKNSRRTSLPEDVIQFIQKLTFTFQGDPKEISPILSLYTERLGATESAR